MKLIIDLQSCQSDSCNGGIGRYSMQLVQAIAQVTDHEVWLLLNEQQPEQVRFIRNMFLGVLPIDRIVSFTTLSDTNELSQVSPLRKRCAELVREKFISDLRPDAVLTTSLFEGLADDAATSIKSLTQNKYVDAVVLYDLIPYKNQEMYLYNDVYRKHYYAKLESIERADVLLAISEFSRDEGRECLSVDPQRIVNISSAIGTYFRAVDLDPKERASVLTQFKITKPFLLYSASFDPRKNQDRLVAAFSRLHRKLRKSVQLVIVGNGTQAIYERLSDLAMENGADIGDVIFTGRVSDETLRVLYNSCKLFVFPSLFEGFGLPPLEAMACGKPAIGSASTSVPEVIGRADALFDPNSVRSIKDKIGAVLTNPEFYAELCEHAQRQAKKFSWTRSASRALDAIECAVNERSGDRMESVWATRGDLFAAIKELVSYEQVTDEFLLELSSIIAINENRAKVLEEVQKPSGFKDNCGIVTTWGTRCGIAEHSKNLMESFSDQYTVFAPYIDMEGITTDPKVVRCWDAGGAVRLSGLTKEILCRKLSFIVIQWNFGFFCSNEFAEMVSRLKEKHVVILVELHATIDPPQDELPRKLSHYASAFRNCDRLWVHSDDDLRRLQEVGVFRNVEVVPLGIPTPTSVVLPKDRVGDEFVIAAYGYFLPHKGFHELIEAMSGLTVAGRRVRLLLVTAEYPTEASARCIESAQALVAELGLGPAVHMITDYLEYSECISHLKCADLIAYPYRESSESSSAAVRMGLASGVPVCVTPLDLFNDVSSCVTRLPGTEVTEIRSGIEQIAAKILASDEMIEEKRRRSDKLIAGYGYDSIARMLRFSLRMAMSENLGYRAPDKIYLASEGKLHTVVGRRIDQGLYSDGKMGVLCYGPYANLGPGSYGLIVYGCCDAGDVLETLIFDVRHGIYSVPFEIETVSKGPALIELTFSIVEPVVGLEVLIQKVGDGDVVVSAVKIFDL